MRFSRVYSEQVLAENFADSRRLFFQPLMDIHRAHLLMLVRQDILPRAEGLALRDALAAITPERVDPVLFDGSFEDLFCYLESLLAEECGAATAGRLHTARSRNDIDVTLYRLRWREELAAILAAALELRRVLIEISEREVETLFPVYTHTQPAQPSTLAHYFLGIVEHLERDQRRLRSALENMNRSPLGSCAATGTGFPIDRRLTARLLAFDGPTGNTYSSIAAADYLLEAASALMVLLNLLGRLLQDLLLWSMREFGFVHIADGLVQPSSIMPQKRNPVAVEHSRALASRALGRASACFHMLHNTPYGDIVDVEDDLQPVAETMFADCRRTLAVLSEVLATACFDREALAAKAAAHWITVTELADHLVRAHGLGFTQAHAVVRETIERADRGEEPAEALADASRERAGAEIRLKREELEEILCPRRFVALRDLEGGPAPKESRRALEAARRTFESDRGWIEQTRTRFDGFRSELHRQLEEL